VRISELTEELEPAFWKHVSQDPLDYCFFILDLRRRREKTQVFLALEKQEICGLMLIYDNEIVQLRGAPESYPSLLSKLGKSKVQITAPMSSKQVLTSLYPAATLQENLMLMRLEKLNKPIKMTRGIKNLEPDASAEIASLMQRTNPVWWGEITSSDVRKSFGDSFWLGIRKAGSLVAVGEARDLEVGGHVVIAATDERSRNKGYATSIVSALVKRLLKTAKVVLIFVLEGNLAAVHAYEKVGFSPYRCYFVLRT
jgi:ribosomal protein S18 acetylase RimI-like enzyme